MYSFGIFSFFLLGLMGGYGHCAGMCNPFVLYVAARFPSSNNSVLQRLSPHLMYNLGRITTYISLGLFCGILGKISSDVSNFQGAAALAAGVFLFSYGTLGLLGFSLAKRVESVTFLKTILNSLAQIQPRHPLLIGLILGFLPCGLVYSALAGALALSNPLLGGVAMALFGLGTMVAMMTLALFGNYLVQKKGLLHKLSLVFLTAMGVYFIVTSLG